MCTRNNLWKFFHCNCNNHLRSEFSVVTSYIKICNRKPIFHKDFLIHNNIKFMLLLKIIQFFASIKFGWFDGLTPFTHPVREKIRPGLTIWKYSISVHFLNSETYILSKVAKVFNYSSKQKYTNTNVIEDRISYRMI